MTCPEDVECTTTTTTTEATTTTTTEAVYDETAVQDYIPLKFTVTGLTDDVDEDVVKQELKGILQMILFELEELEKDSGLKVLDVAAWGRRELTDITGENTGGDYIRGRKLQDVPHEMMFNVAVSQVEGVDFGPVIIEGIRKRYDSLVEDVRGWTDSEYVTNDFAFDVCAYSEMLGGYNDCAVSDAAAGGGGSNEYSEGSSYTSDSSTVNSSTMSSSNANSKEGLSKVIVIIISFVGVLLFFCILSIILFIGCRKDDMSDYEPDDYSEDDRLRGKRGRSYSEGESSKSTAENSAHQLVPFNEKEAGEYPEKCYVDEDEHNSTVLPHGAIPPAMTKSSGSVYSNTGASHRSHKSGSKRSERRSRRGDASGYEVRSTASSVSSYARPKVKHPDPSVYNVREGAEDPSVQSRTRRADPSVYNQNLRDPDEVPSAFKSDPFSDHLESLASGSKRGGKGGSVRMDYSVVSELSEPSIADRFS